MFGVYAAGWNPANLGLKANPAFGVTFLSVGTSFGNNAFTPEYIGKTFVEGDTLTDEKIAEILGKVEANDLGIYGFSGIPILGVSIGPYALNIDGFALARGSIASDLLALGLRGPVRDEVYRFDDFDLQAMGYVSASFSFAKRLHPSGLLKELSIGATFKYISGAGYLDLVEKHGSLQITREKISTDGFFKLLESRTGDGVGLDLGVATVVEPLDIYCGLTAGNLIGSINWTDVTAREVRFFRDDGLDIDSLTDKRYVEHLFNQNDTSYSVGSVTSSLPSYILLSVAKALLGGRVNLYGSYYQGLDDAPGHSRTPRLALGSELMFVPLFPVRFGFSVGGTEGFQVSGGFGLKLPGYQLNVGGSYQRGVFAGAQGLSLAVGNYIGRSSY